MKPMTQRRSGSWAHAEQPAPTSQEAAPQKWEREWREAAATDRREAVRARLTARSRIGLLLLAATLAAAASTVLWWTPGFSTDDTKAAIIACAVAALVAVSIVPLANRVGAARDDSGSGDRLLFTAALASAGAAAIHFAVIGMHFDEYVLYGVFFVVSAIAQLVWPIWLLLRRWRPLLALGAIGNAAIVALWIIDRIGWVPIGPDATDPPPFGLADSVASGFELLLVVVCTVALVRGRGRPLRLRTNFALTLTAAALTTLAFLSVLGVGSSILPPAT
jgi:hypothetical protein